MKYILSLMAIVLMVGCNSKVEEKSAVDTSNIIIDNAYVVLDNDKFMQQYREFNAHLINEFDIDFRTITTSDDVDIDSYANKEFTRLQQESRSQSGKAILMVVNTLQDKVRLEVSMALEPVYTDAFVSYIERKGLVPYFRNNNMIDAIYMAAELISDRAYDASVGQAFMPPMQSKSIGAGAKTQAHIGKTNHSEKRGDSVTASSTDTPIDVFHKYLKALKSHNKNPNLDIYTDTSKRFFAKWTVTDINQDHEVENISKCLDKHEILYDTFDTHAVLASRPYDVHRTCSPYFFKKEEGKWKLDIATMAQTLRFNAQMQWHFDMQKRLEGEGMYYAYAFDGYTFDNNGYPFQPEEKKPNDGRWGFQCGQWYHPKDAKNVKSAPEKYIRCGIMRVWRGSPAEVRLGLSIEDYIYGVGEGAHYINNATYVQFMEYMKNVPSGEVATVVVRLNHGKKVIRQGIAP